MRGGEDGPLLLTYHSRDREFLERAAILTSWESTDLAKGLLEFPDGVWHDEAHRTAIRAIRGLLREGREINRPALFGWVKENDHDHLPEFTFLEMEASDPDFIHKYSGVRTEALLQLRTEYEWEMASRWLQLMSNTVRRLPFKDWYTRAVESVRGLMPESLTDGVRRMSDVVRDRMLARMKGDVQKGYIMTGIKELDRILGGMQGDQMPVVVGPPGAGKSTLMYQILKNNSLANYLSLCHQGDMPVEDMADREAIMSVGKPLSEFTRSDYEKAMDQARFVDNILVDDRHITAEEWETKTATVLAKHPGLSIVATDYLGQIEVPGARGEAEETRHLAKVGRRIAKANKLCHFLLQQPNQIYEEEKWPRTRHIRGSKIVEALAHCILFIHRPAQFDSRVPADYLQIHVLKNRGGELGIVPVKWDRARFTMTDWPGEVLCPAPGEFYNQRLPEDQSAGRLSEVLTEELPL